MHLLAEHSCDKLAQTLGPRAQHKVRECDLDYKYVIGFVFVYVCVFVGK